MSIDILNMRQYSEDKRAINIALPVLAYECELTPPINKYLNAYEYAVLKLLSIGLSIGGISKSLNATESLIGRILSDLKFKEFVIKEKNEPWKVLNEKLNYFSENEKKIVSSNSEFGFMFVNAIRKNVLPFFYQGDIGKISLYRGEHLPERLMINGKETDTFNAKRPRNIRLRDAYKDYIQSQNISINYDEGNITIEEARDLFENLDSFDEESEDEMVNTTEESKKEKMDSKKFIRILECEPKRVFLRMQLIIDSRIPGGYKVESPFPLNGIDNNYFLRQIQWMVSNGNTYIEEENLSDFMSREILKIAPEYKTNEKDYTVYILEKAPLLSVHKNKYHKVYNDLAMVYNLIVAQRSLIEKENIVNSIYKYALEQLLKLYFKPFDKDQLEMIKKNAYDTIELYKIKYRESHDSSYAVDKYVDELIKSTSINKNEFPWSGNFIQSAIGRLPSTNGNSIVEKFVNLFVINYYRSSKSIDNLLNRKDLLDLVKLIESLNLIRRKVAHITDDIFTTKDYDFFISNVFDLINGFLESLEEV